MKLHYAPPEASYTVCGRYAYNSLTVRITTDPELADCLSCQNEIKRREPCDHAFTIIYAIPRMIGKWPTGEYAQWRRCRCGQVRVPEEVYQNRRQATCSADVTP